MWSKAGLIGMAFQEFINDVHLMKTNLQHINDGGMLEQVPNEVGERDFYYLYWEAIQDPCKWKEKLFPYEQLSDETVIGDEGWDSAKMWMMAEDYRE